METGGQKSGDGNRKNEVFTQMTGKSNNTDQLKEHHFTIHKAGAKPIYIQDLPYIQPAVADSGVK